MDISHPVALCCFLHFPVTHTHTHIYIYTHTQRHESCPYNRVVGWSAFPLCDPKFDVVKGKHKAPMLRGPYDPSIDNYQKLDGVMRNDLVCCGPLVPSFFWTGCPVPPAEDVWGTHLQENWIGNLYFEIRHMPRSMRGMNKTEFDVELEFTSKLLHLNYAERMVCAGHCRLRVNLFRPKFLIICSSVQWCPIESHFSLLSSL